MKAAVVTLEPGERRGSRVACRAAAPDAASAPEGARREAWATKPKPKDAASVLKTGILRTGSPPFAHSFPGPGDARGIPYGPGGAARRLWTKRGLPCSTPGRKSKGPPEAGLKAGQQGEGEATGNLVGGPNAAGSLATSARVEHAPSSR